MPSTWLLSTRGWSSFGLRCSPRESPSSPHSRPQIHTTSMQPRFIRCKPTRTQHSSSCPPPTAPPRGDHLSFVSPRVSDPVSTSLFRSVFRAGCRRRGNSIAAATNVRYSFSAASTDSLRAPSRFSRVDRLPNYHVLERYREQVYVAGQSAAQKIPPAAAAAAPRRIPEHVRVGVAAAQPAAAVLDEQGYIPAGKSQCTPRRCG